MAGELTLIKDVGDALGRLLVDNVDELQPVNSINFGPPPEEPAQNGLSLFLYLVMENAHLKNQENEQDVGDKLRYPPLTLDLYYLLTPFSRADNPNEAQGVEKMILAKVMRTFHDNSILRGPSLGDSLLETGNSELKVVLNDISIEQLYQLWTIFKDTTYRLSVSYSVTPLKIPSTRELITKRVIAKELEFYQLGKG